MQILFEHPWFVVINKPTDLLSQAVDGIDSVQTKLEEELRPLTPSGANPFVGIPHRLDRVTTGIMVVARNQRALRRLSEQFASRKVRKTYHALVENLATKESTIVTWASRPEEPLQDRARRPGHGEEAPNFPGVNDSPNLANQSIIKEASRWEDWMRKIPDVAKGEICAEGDEGARQGVLHQRLLRQGMLSHSPNRLSLLEVELETGRMHQIRLQCAVRGYPIVGDSLYGSTMTWLEGTFWQSPIALHARTIEFHHPQTSELLRFEAPYPEAWDRIQWT